MSTNEKKVKWIGRARAELLNFPPVALHEAGYSLGSVQEGRDPENWKPMETIGPGAREIRIRTHEGGAVQHRVVYVAKFEEAVYVLHAFEKRTERTSQHNIDVARARYAQMLRERMENADPKQRSLR